MIAIDDKRLLTSLLRRPPWDERCETCACWERFTGDQWGVCRKPGAPPHDNLTHCHADAVCDIWEPTNS